MRRKSIGRFLLTFYSYQYLYLQFTICLLGVSVHLHKAQLVQNLLNCRRVKYRCEIKYFFLLILLHIVLYGLCWEIWFRMTSIGKASVSAVGAWECQELRLGWEHSALSGCLIHSSSSYCHFLQAGKLAVDRGWAINVGEYKWKFVLNDT